MVATTMHGLRAIDRERADDLVYEEMSVPAAGIGDVLVEVAAASVTPTELDWPSTWVDRAGRDRAPTVPGHEVSGRVVAVGYGTTGFAPGDEVFGVTDWYRDGAAAGFVAVEARNLAPKPSSVSHAAAAAIALPGLTAWQALFVHGALRSGQTVLINGASGGVGTTAVQLARHAGAHVIGVARGWAHDLVLGLGAEECVDADAIDGRPDRVDLIFDLVGGEVLKRCLSLLGPEGAVVSVVEPPSAPVGRRLEPRGGFFVLEPDRSQLVELAQFVGSGILRPVIGQELPLPDAASAFGAKHSGGVPGKVVLRPPAG